MSTIISLTLPPALATAVSLEAARNGQSPASWVLDRLHDRFALRDPSRASAVPIASDPTLERRI